MNRIFDYLRMKPIERVKNGYLTHTENFHITQSWAVVDPRTRFLLKLKARAMGIWRAASGRVVKFDDLKKSLLVMHTDLSQCDSDAPSKYYEFIKSKDGRW